MTVRTINKILSSSVAIPVALLIVVGLSKYGILNTPFYWDEMGAYVAPSHWLAENGLHKVFPGLHPAGQFYGHPPLFFLSLATLYKVFGESIWISHIFALGFAFLGVYSTYLIGKHIGNRTTGIIAALFLFSTPLYFAQSGMVLGDIPVAALGAASVYLAIKRKWGSYLILATSLVLLKETSAAIIVAIVLYVAWQERKRDKNNWRRFWIQIAKYSLPLLILAAFLVLQKIISGSFLPNPYFESHSLFSLDPGQVMSKGKKVLKWIFTYQNRLLITLLAMIALAPKNRHEWGDEFLLFIMIISFFIAAFSFAYFLPRYILPVLPYLCVLAAFGLVRVVPALQGQVIVAGLVIMLSLAANRGSGTGYDSFEYDMQYEDVVSTHVAAAVYLQQNFPDRAILANWPLSHALRNPYVGYVTEPMKVVTLEDSFEIIVFSPQSGNAGRKMAEAVAERETTLLERFEKNGKFVEIYQVR